MGIYVAHVLFLAFAVLFYGVGRAVWNRDVPFHPPAWRFVPGLY